MSKVKRLPKKLGENLTLNLDNGDYLYCEGYGGNFLTALNFLNENKYIKFFGLLEGQAMSSHGLILLNCFESYLSDFASVYLHPLKFNISLPQEEKLLYQQEYQRLIPFNIDIPKRGLILTSKDLVELNPKRFKRFSPNLSSELYLQI